MAPMEELKSIFDRYIEISAQIRKKAPAWAGLFGLGNDPRKDRCHDEFFKAMDVWAAEFTAADPSPEETAEAVSFIIRAAHDHQDSPDYWYLYAVQGVTRTLIPRMTAADCLVLQEFYDEVYPVIDRPPVQQEVYRLLQKQSGHGKKPASFWQRLFGKK